MQCPSSSSLYFDREKHFLHLFREFDALSIQSFDVKQFWTLELDKSVKKIRHDFELLYATIYREMTMYYEIKMEEVTKDVEHALSYQKIEIEEWSTVRQQKLQAEYEEVQNSYSHEKEILIKFEGMYGK